jgi:hypothetical protein
VVTNKVKLPQQFFPSSIAFFIFFIIEFYLQHQTWWALSIAENLWLPHFLAADLKIFEYFIFFFITILHFDNKI